jgi:hypothetical protein
MKVTFVRGAVVAALLSVFTVTGASAAPMGPGVSFGFHVGPGSGVYDPGFYDDCISDSRIVRRLRAAGYRMVTLVDDQGDVLVFEARKGKRWYELEVDSCTGEILSRARIRR